MKKNKNNRFEIKDIIVPTDFSGHSEVAMDYALFLAGHFKTQVRVLHVIDESTISSIKHSLMSSPEDQMKKLSIIIRKNAGHFMDKFIAKFSKKGVKISTEITRGIPFLEIIRHAQRKKASMIIMGTKGLTGIKSILIGSTAEKVVRKSYCPVLTIKSKEFDFELS